MAVDNRPFKSKEQDGQGNEVIIRDQQLVEQGTTTTMPAGACFQTLDVDGRPVKIPKDNMLNLIVEGLGIIFSGQSDQQTVTKVPTLNGNNFGASTVATLASVLGVNTRNFLGQAYILDANTIVAPPGEFGVYYCFVNDISTSSTHFPNNDTFGNLLSISFPQNGIFQVWFSANNGIYYRFGWSTGSITSEWVSLGVTLLRQAKVDSGSPLTVANVGNGHGALISITGSGWSYACFVQRYLDGVASTPFVLNGNLPNEITVAWSNTNDSFVLQSTSSYSLRYAVIIL